MKPERTFVAQRALARHCPELLARAAAPQAGDVAPRLARLSEALARGFAQGIARLTGGDAPAVRAGAPRDMAIDALAGEIAPLAANSLLCAGDIPVLASIPAETVFRLLDRTFGGRGEAPSPLPDVFPLSADLFIARLADIAASALAAALGEGGAPVRAVRCDGNLARLAPFPAPGDLVAITLAVEGEGEDPWNVLVALPRDAIARLCGSQPAAGPVRHPQADPASEPFAAMPLGVRAVLVDMAVPFARVAALRPGDVLPVSVARTVPLRIADRTIAHGTVGAVDDRVAIQITKAF